VGEGRGGVGLKIVLLSALPAAILSLLAALGIMSYLLVSSTSTLGQPRIYVASSPWYVKLLTVLDYS